MVRETQPPRDTWRVELVNQKTENGIVLVEWLVREAGKEPFLLANAKAQWREQQQRIITDPDGKFLHVSGLAVSPEEMAEFMRDSVEAYRWRDKDRNGNWRDDRGRVLTPFGFHAAPWAGGQLEELDPQWQRETYLLSIDSQRDAMLERYQRYMLQKGWTGDKRGTLEALVVGADTNDYNNSQLNGFDATSPVNGLAAGDLFANFSTESSGCRFTSVDIANAATINTAQIEGVAFGTLSTTTTNWNIHAVDADNAAAPTTAGEFTGQSLTAATAWNDVPAMTANDVINAADGLPDIASRVQTVINRAGWATGNAMCIQWKDNASSNDAYRTFYDYGADSGKATKLDIDYTAGGATAVKDIIGGGGVIPFAR